MDKLRIDTIYYGSPGAHSNVLFLPFNFEFYVLTFYFYLLTFYFYQNEKNQMRSVTTVITLY